MSWGLKKNHFFTPKQRHRTLDRRIDRPNRKLEQGKGGKSQLAERSFLQRQRSKRGGGCGTKMGGGRRWIQRLGGVRGAGLGTEGRAVWWASASTYIYGEGKKLIRLWNSLNQETPAQEHRFGTAVGQGFGRGCVGPVKNFIGGRRGWNIVFERQGNYRSLAGGDKREFRSFAFYFPRNADGFKKI